MDNREKVINGLREMSCRATWKDIDRIRNKFQPIINGAIDFLKDQETEAEIEGGGSVWWFVCRECRGTIDPYDKYCKHCGRLVIRNG